MAQDLGGGLTRSEARGLKMALVLGAGGLEVADGYADLMLLLPGDSAV